MNKTKPYHITYFYHSIFAFLLVIPKILLFIALRCVPLPDFLCFPVKFSACNLARTASHQVSLTSVQCPHISPSQYPKSLLNAKTLLHYMQTGMQQDEPAQNIPYESHTFSPNIPSV